MKKKNALITLVSATALLCVGGGFALNASTAVSAEETKMQTMLGASILVANEQTGIDSNGIRFPVVVTDEVAGKITESKTYVLPAEFWTGANAPTAEEVKTSGTAFETTDKWVNYYELNAGYGDAYSEAVVYMYNIPDTKYATDFYVCSWLKLNDNTEEMSDVVCRSMQDVAVSAVESGAYDIAQLNKYLTATTYKVNHYLRTNTGAYVLDKTTPAENGFVGLGATITPETIKGYTYNATLTAQANAGIKLENSETTLACYYENDSYKFTKTTFTNGSQVDGVTTVTDGQMQDVSFEDLRGNVQVYKKNISNAPCVQNKIYYSAENIGQYLILNAYWLSCPNQFGFCAWENVQTDDSTQKTVYEKLATYYDQEGNRFTPNTTNVLNRWTVIALYLDPVHFSTQKSAFNIGFDNWSGASLYLGEYRFMPAEEYNQTLRNYTVEFDSDGGNTINAQTMKYGATVEKPANPEKDGANFLYWTADGETEYNFNTPVTADMKLTAVWESLGITAQYTVKRYFRQINGAYLSDVQEMEVFEGTVGDVVTATVKTYDGYTYNTTLSATTITGTVVEGDSLVLACYYENNNYIFKKMSLTSNPAGISVNTQQMTGVSYDDLRGNTVKYQETNGQSGAPYSLFNHGSLTQGDWLLLNVYVTKKTTNNALFRGRKGTTWNYVGWRVYDSNFAETIVDKNDANKQDAMLNKWMTIAVSIDGFGTATSSYFTFAEYNPNIEMYIGEYTTLTSEQFTTHFAQPQA